MDMIKELLIHWAKHIGKAILLMVAISVLCWIIFNTGNSRGRYIDYGDYSQNIYD